MADAVTIPRLLLVVPYPYDSPVVGSVGSACIYGPRQSEGSRALGVPLRSSPVEGADVAYRAPR